MDDEKRKWLPWSEAGSAPEFNRLSRDDFFLPRAISKHPEFWQVVDQFACWKAWAVDLSPKKTIDWRSETLT